MQVAVKTDPGHPWATNTISLVSGRLNGAGKTLEAQHVELANIVARLVDHVARTTSDKLAIIGADDDLMEAPGQVAPVPTPPPEIPTVVIDMNEGVIQFVRSTAQIRVIVLDVSNDVAALYPHGEIKMVEGHTTRICSEFIHCDLETQLDIADILKEIAA